MGISAELFKLQGMGMGEDAWSKVKKIEGESEKKGASQGKAEPDQKCSIWAVMPCN